ncbi:MAG TPA: VOC family protein [Jatrophihabitans sp.]|jgi:predicted enzyme related to lactoylglutathione lyase
MAIKTVIYPVRDVDAAKAMFTGLLGTAPDMDEPYYVQWNVDGQAIGLDPNGHNKGMTGPVGYYHVDDIATAAKRLVDAGGTETEAAHDVGGGRLVATVTDADGNPIGLIQSPW